MDRVRITLFKGSQKSFTSALDAAEIKYGRIVQLSEAPMAAGFAIEVLNTLQTASPWAALAAVMIQWIRSKHSREIQITTKENQIFHGKNLTKEEFEKVLSNARFAIAIDTQPDTQA